MVTYPRWPPLTQVNKCICVFTHTVYINICMLGHNANYITLCGLKSLKPRLEDLKSVFSSFLVSLPDFYLFLAQQSDLFSDVVLSVRVHFYSISFLWPIATHVDIWKENRVIWRWRRNQRPLFIRFLLDFVLPIIFRIVKIRVI